MWKKREENKKVEKRKKGGKKKVKNVSGMGFELMSNYTPENITTKPL